MVSLNHLKNRNILLIFYPALRTESDAHDNHKVEGKASDSSLARSGFPLDMVWALDISWNTP
ncbi:MAG: hypothetical protein LZF62_50235 [Nitrospira sp.]|nr:MAG: hypothetical protein LZF62_50235 [Nitrospira sp.]